MKHTLEAPEKVSFSEVREVLSHFWNVLGEVKNGHRDLVLGTMLLLTNTTLFYVLTPFIISVMVGEAVESQGVVSSYLITLGILLIATLGTSSVALHYGWLKIDLHVEKVSAQLLQNAMSRLLRYTHGFFADRKVGGLVSDVAEYIRSYEVLVFTIVSDVITICISYLFSMIVISFVAPIMLIPLGLASVYVIVNAINSSKVRRIYRGQKKQVLSERMGLVSDILSNHSLVRVFGKRDKELANVNRMSKKVIDWSREDYVRALGAASRRFRVVALLQIAAIVLAIWLLQNDLLSVAALVFVVAYITRLSSTMLGLTSIVRSIETSILDAKHMKEILDLPIGVEDAPHANVLAVERGDIEFRNISFSYKADPDDQEVFFKNFSLKIPAGQRVGVVGASGGGKTTLTQLLMRYADVQNGEILVDGHNIAEVSQDSLRNQIAYVPQDPFLFHRSIRENISYAKPDTALEKIKDIARSARADEFIDELTYGYETQIGERGVKLSGGQRQRIGIARAMLMNAPILVLDEATSALDSESEKHVQSALVELMKGRTALVVAHRLSTISHLDRIVVLDKGTIIEDGTHIELLEKNGKYAKLWAHQSGGFV